MIRRLIQCIPPFFSMATCNHSPLWQAQEQVLLWTLREARNSEPADAPVAVLIFRSSADTDSVFDHIATGRGGVDCGRVCESADELHLRKRSGGGGGECASSGAREGGAEGEHCVCVCVCVCVAFDVECVWCCWSCAGNAQLLMDAGVFLGSCLADQTRWPDLRDVKRVSGPSSNFTSRMSFRRSWTTFYNNYTKILKASIDPGGCF